MNSNQVIVSIALIIAVFFIAIISLGNIKERHRLTLIKELAEKTNDPIGAACALNNNYREPCQIYIYKKYGNDK